MNEFETKIANITTDLADTLIAKNHDYGDAFHESVAEFGDVVMLIRLNDKLNRLKTLLNGQNQSVADESIRDTLMDLAGYAMLAVIELDTRPRPSDKEVPDPAVEATTKSIRRMHPELKTED